MGAIKYLSNVSKSVGYTAVDVIKDLNPVLTSFAETNAEVTTAAYRSLKEFKVSSKKLTRVIASNEYTQFGASALKNAWSDVKTGKWYNKARIDAADNAAADKMLGEDNIFGNYDDDFDSEDDPFGGGDDPFSGPDAGDEFLADSMDEVGGRTSSAISSAVLNATEVQIGAQSEMFSKQQASNHIMFSQVRQDLGAISTNLANMVRFDSEVMQTHVQNSTQFYETQTSLMTETRDMLKEMLELQRTPGKYDSQDENLFYNMFDAEGNVDLSAFGKRTKDKFMNSDIGSMISMVKDMKEVGGLDAIAASPLSFIMKTGMNKLIAPTVKQAMTGLNDTVSGLFSSFLMKATNWVGSDNLFKNLAGELFGIDESVSNGYSVSQYEKGKVSWTGKDHKALTEVIPTLLSSIDARLGGDNKRFDYESGKFISTKKIKESYDNLPKNAARNASSDIFYKYIQPALQEMQFETEADKDAMYEAFDKISIKSFKDTKGFNPREKHDPSDYEFNFGSEEKNVEVMRRMEQIIDTMVPKSVLLKYNNQLITAMQSYNSMMEDIEKSGDSIYNALINDSIDENFVTYAGGNNNGGSNNNVGRKRNRKRNRKKSKVETIAGNTSSKSIRDANDAVRLEQLKKEEPHMFDSKGNLKSGYELKDGKIVSTGKISKTGIAFIDERIGANNNEFDGEDDEEKRMTISDKLDKSQKPIANFINKLSETFYNKFFPKDSEDDEEAGMSFTQKISYSMSNYMDETMNKLSESLDKLTEFKDKLFDRENVKNFMKEWFGIDTEKVSHYFKDVLFGPEGDSEKGGVLGHLGKSLKIGFKGVKNYVKGAANDVSNWLAVDDEMRADQQRNIENRNRLNALLSEPIPDDDEHVSIRDAFSDGSGSGILGSFATGTHGRKIEKTGTYLLSEGEQVITPENGSGSEEAKAIKNRMVGELKSLKKSNKDLKDEDAEDKVYGDTWNNLVKVGDWDGILNLMEVHKNFTKWVQKDKGRINQLKDFTHTEITGKDKLKHFGKQMGRNAKGAIGVGKDLLDDARKEFTISNEDKEEFLKNAETVNGEIKENFPNFLTGGVLGAGVSLATSAVGGPLLGAAAGSAIGLLTSSQKVQDMVFGKLDEETGQRNGGLLSKDVSNIILKYAPNVSKGATLGAITSLVPFIPGGPIAGMLVGSAIGFISKNEEAQKLIYGMLGDTDEETVKKKVQSVLPKMGVGALAGAAGSLIFGGPLGLTGNILLGSALGFASDTDKFKKAFLGEKDKDGKYQGGIYGSIRDFLNENLAKPMKDLWNPLKTQVKVLFESIGDHAKNLFTSIGNLIKGHLKKTWLGQKVAKAGKFVGKVLTAPVKLPFQLLGKGMRAAETGLRKHQLKAGTAYMNKDMSTAAQRDEYARKYGLDNYATRSVDALYRNMTDKDLDQLQGIQNTAQAIFDSSGYAKKKTTEVKNNITGTLNQEKFSSALTDTIRKELRQLVMTGNFKAVKEYLDNVTGLVNLDPKDKKQLYDDAIKAAQKIAAVKAADPDKLKEMAKDEIESQTGFRSDNDSDYKDLAKITGNEIDRIVNTPEEEKVQQNVDSIDENTTKMVTTLDSIANLLRDYVYGKTDDEGKSLEAVDHDYKNMSAAESEGLNPVDAKYKAKRDAENLIEQGKVDVNNQDVYDKMHVALGDSGYDDGSAGKILDRAKRKANGEMWYQKAASAVKGAPGKLKNGIKNGIKTYKNAKYDVHTQSILREYGGSGSSLLNGRGVDDDELPESTQQSSQNNLDDNTPLSRLIKAEIARMSGEGDTLRKKFGYFANSEGKPIKYIENEKGERIVDKSDSETAQNIADEKQNKVDANQNLISGIASGFGDKLRSIFNPDPDEEKKPNLLLRLLDGIIGENGLVSKVKSFGAAIPGMIMKFIPLAFVGAASTGAFDGIISKLSGGMFGNDDKTKMYTDTDGNKRWLQTDEKGNLIKDADGNYLDKDGTAVSSDTYIETAHSTSTSSISDRLQSNFVRGTLTRKGSIIGTIAKKNPVGKTASKILDSVKKMTDVAASNDIGVKVRDIVGKFTSKLKHVPLIGGIADKLDDLAIKFSEFVVDNLPKAGAKLNGISNALGKIAIPITVAMAVGDFVSGYQDANATLKITGKCTMGQKMYSGLLRSLKNLIPVVGTFIPDSALSDFLVGFVGPIFGINKDELLKQQADAQAEVDAYNAENGTDLSFEDYNKQVLGNYTVGEKFKNTVSSFKANVKEKGFKGAVTSTAGAVKDNISRKLSNIGEALGETKVARSVVDITKNIAAAHQATLKGDIKGLWAIKAEEAEDNPANGIEKGTLFAYKLMSTPSALMSLIGHKIWGSISPLVKGVKDTYNRFKTYGDSLKNLADNGDVKGIMQTDFGDSEHANPLSPIFAAIAGIQKAFYVIQGAFNILGNGVKHIKDKIGNVLNNFFGDDESVTEEESGSGSGLFISQRDPKYANTRFNVKGDTKAQTIADTGCAPASATMAINIAKANGAGSDMMSASENALHYKVNNEGVTPDYFADEFARNGIGSEYTRSSNDIASSLRSNNPVVLLGQDKSNTSKQNSPFGSNNHYVTATGISGDGSKIYINDPEASRGNIPYSASKILGSTKLGIATTGRGSGLSGKFKSILSKYAGRGTMTSEQLEKRVWERMIGAGYSEYSVAGAMGSIYAESSFNPSAIEKGSGAGYGLCQWTGGRRTQLEGFASARNASPNDPELQIDFLLAELTKGIKDPNVSYQLMPTSPGDGQKYTPDMWLNATDLSTSAKAFCFTFERPKFKYAHVDRRIEKAKEYYQRFTGTPGVIGNSTYDSPSTISSGDSTTTSVDNSNSDSSSGGSFISKLGSVFDSLAAAIGLTGLSGSNNKTSSDGSVDGTSEAVTDENSVADMSGVTGYVSADPTLSDKQKALVATMKGLKGKLHYSQKQRDVEKGSGDCSSTTQYAYKKILGVDPGGWTGAMRDDQNTYTVATNVNDESKLQLGDLLLRDGHVEMYEGNGQMIGHGGPDWNDMGPTEKPLGQSYKNKPYNLVRRWVGFKDTGSVPVDNPSASSNHPDLKVAKGGATMQASGSGLDLNNRPPVQVDKPSSSAVLTTQRNSPNNANTQNLSNTIDILKVLVKSVSQIADNTAIIQQIATILVKLSDIVANQSVASGAGNEATNKAVLNNAKEIANMKSALVGMMSDNAKSSTSTDLEGLIKSVESLTVQ